MSNERFYNSFCIAMLLTACAACSRTQKEVTFDESTTTSISDSNTVIEQSFAEQLAAVKSEQSRLINVTEYQVTKDDIAKLAEAKFLRTLQLDGGAVNANALLQLPKIDELQHLRIRETEISDDVLIHIVETYPNLAILNFPQVTLSEASIARLRELKKLTSLRLGGRTLDGNLLDQLATLEKLQHLHLIGPTLNDEDLSKIANLRALKSFYLDECKLSDEAWKKLFAQRPALHVHLDQYHHDRDPNRHEH